jgi:hypothetical protein
MRVSVLVLTVVCLAATTSVGAQFYDPKRATPKVTDEEREALRNALQGSAASIKEQRVRSLEAVAAQVDDNARQQRDPEIASLLRWRADSLRMVAANIRDPSSPRPGARTVSSAGASRRASGAENAPAASMSESPATTTYVPYPPTDSPSPSPLERIPAARNEPRMPARIMVYARSLDAGAVNVFVDDLVQGGLIRARSSAGSCGAPDAITVPVRPGSHKLFAETAGGRASWGPVSVTVQDGECYVWPLQLAPGAIAAREKATRGDDKVNVVFWTRRSLNTERKQLLVEGRNVSPAAWSYMQPPTECGRMPAYAVFQFQPGERVAVELRKSDDSARTLIASDQFLVPDTRCWFYEIR